MTDEHTMKSCEQCGQETLASKLIVDEESGLLLCPVCAREAESCGCSDETAG
jgi:hypothetical protein